MLDDLEFPTDRQYDGDCWATFDLEFPNDGHTTDDTGLPTMSDNWDLPTGKHSDDDCHTACS